MGISQEKLAELAEISVQMVNGIEGCRTWVSDKTLIKLARVLDVEVFQLLLPFFDSKTTKNTNFRLNTMLDSLKQTINNDVNTRFDLFFRSLH